MAGRLSAGALFLCVACASAAGWAAFAAGAGGSGVSDPARITAAVQAAAGKGVVDAPRIQDVTSALLGPREVELLTALHTAAVRAGRADVATAIERTLAGVRMRPNEPALVAAIPKTRLGLDSSSLISGSTRGHITSETWDSADLVVAETARVSAFRADVTSAASAASTGLAAANDVATLADLLVRFLLALESASGLSESAVAAGRFAREDGVVSAVLAEQGHRTASLQTLADAAIAAAGMRQPADVRYGDLASAHIGAVIRERSWLSDEAGTTSFTRDLDDLIDATYAAIVAAYVETPVVRASLDAGALAAVLSAAATMREGAVTRQAHAGRTHLADAHRSRFGSSAAEPQTLAELVASAAASSAGEGVATLVAPARSRSAQRHTAFASVEALTLARLWLWRQDLTSLGVSLESRSARSPAAVFDLGALAASRTVARQDLPVGVRSEAMAAVEKRSADFGRIEVVVAVSVVLAGGANAVEPSTVQVEAITDDPDAGEGPELSEAIVPPILITSNPPQGEVLSVVWPGRPATLHVPDQGVTLRVPAGARRTVFQTRVSVENPDSLEVKPAGKVLRVVRIEIYDALGRPVDDPTPEKPLDLAIRLDAADLGRRDLLRVQRFEPETAVPTWLDVPVVEVRSDEVVATLDHLSLFALVAGGDRPGAAASQATSPGDAAPDISVTRHGDREAGAVAIWVVVAVGTGVPLSVWAAERFFRRRSRSP
jgi:hypothetical protein